MKRKQFLNRLIKISQQHESLNSNRNSAVSKQERHLKPQPIITRLMPKETASHNIDRNPINSKETIVLKQELVTSKILIHSQNNSNIIYRRISSNRRLKTTPTHAKGNASQVEDLTKLIEQNYKNTCLYDQAEQKRHHYVSAEINLSETLPHYLEIKEIQPKPPSRRPPKQIPSYKRVSAKLTQKNEVHFKKHSLTEPAESPAKDNTQRLLPFQGKAENQSALSQQFKKNNRAIRQKYHNSNKIKLSVRKEINKNYNKHFNPPPRLTAKSYIIYEVKPTKQQSKVITSFNSKNTQEVASLTKIMTCVLILEISTLLQVDRNGEQVIIGKLEANVGGTTASLNAGEIYTVQQLLLGLMLPSGNDASMALAIWGGRKLQEKDVSDPTIKYTKIQCYNRFIQEMNTKARQLGMVKTSYANSHGLINPNNKSTAYDIAILCEYAMSNESFRNIVQCRQYKGIVRYNQEYRRYQEKIYRRESEETSVVDEQEQGRRSPAKQFSLPQSSKAIDKRIGVQWQNTHKLLHLRPKQYLGIKTGYTTSAGPCLSSFITLNNRNFIIIVLGCGRVSLRFKQTEVLRRWLIKHENLKKKKVKEGDRVEEQQEQLQQKQVEFMLQNMKVDQQKQD